MQYRTDWKQFLKYDEKGRRSHEFPVYLVDTAPNEKQYLYHDEYTALVAAEKAAKDARRAAREAELAASRPEASESRASVQGLRADPANPSDPVAILAGPPDFERHSRRCLICSHPDRDAIEGEFIRWRSPHKIARDYDITDRTTIYRHAHATNLFEARRRQIGRVLESYLETIDDTPPADFDPVTRAVRVYAHLNANGAWVEPLRRVHITTSRAPWPDGDHPEFDPDSDFEPDQGPIGPATMSPEISGAESINNGGCLGGRSFSSDKTAEAPEFTRGEQRFSAAEKNADPFTSRRHQPPTSSPVTRDCPSGESPQQTTLTGRPSRNHRRRSTESRVAGGKISTKVAAFGRESKRAASAADTFGANPSALLAQAPNGAFHESQITPARRGGNHQSRILGGEEKANRNNPRIKNRRNRLHRKDITKVNRNKNATSASPHLRLFLFKTLEKFRCRMAVPRLRARVEVGGCCGNW